MYSQSINYYKGYSDLYTRALPVPEQPYSNTIISGVRCINEVKFPSMAWYFGAQVLKYANQYLLFVGGVVDLSRAILS
jgi:hypothetical protein